MNRAAFDAGAVVKDDAASRAEPDSDVVVARGWSHGALPGRAVVRLVPEGLVAGADAEARVSGFVGSTSAQVGRQRRRSLGFPQWTLVNDAKHGALALSLVPKFRSLARTAASKPGAARDAYTELARTFERKAPSVLPTFHEQVARVFVEAGNPKLAATFFDKARAAEQAYGLRPDGARLAEVFLEFALSGAVTVKSIQAWVKDVGAADGAGAALERLHQLAVGRTHGGLPPWASFPKDLAKLASGAGADPVEAQARYLREVLGAPALDLLSADSWKALEPAVKQILADPTARAVLASRFPKGTSSRWDDVDDEFAESWIGWLGDAGALDPATLAPDWLSRFLSWAPDDFGLTLTITRWFASRERPVTVDRSWVAADVLDLLLELGVPFTLSEDADLRLRGWASGEPVPARFGRPAEARPRDLVYLLGHPEHREVALRLVPRALSEPAFAEVARSRPLIAKARVDALDALLRKAASQPTDDADDAVSTLEDIAYDSFAGDPALAALAASLTAAGPLAASLRGGVIEERVWPAWEAALEEVGAGDVVVGGCWPWLVVATEQKVVVLGPDGERAFALDVRKPKGGELRAVRVIDGQVLFGWSTDDGERACWSGDQRDLFEADVPWYGTDVMPALAVPGKGWFTGGGVTAAGDRAWPAEVELLMDGEQAWAVEDGTCVARGDGSGPPTSKRRPSFLDDVPDEHLGSAHLWPMGAGPAGLRTLDGTRWETLDGVTMDLEDTPEWIGTWPGGGVRALEAGWRGVSLIGEGDAKVDSLRGDRTMPVLGWWRTRTRDEAASRALRAMDTDRAAALLTALSGDVEDDAAAGVLAASFPDLAVPGIRDGVLRAVSAARALADRLDTWRTGDSDSEEETPDGVPTLRRWASVLGLAASGRQRDDTDLLRAVAERDAFLTGATDDRPLAFEESLHLASPRAIGWAFVRPSLSDEDRELLRTVLAAWLARPALRVRVAAWTFPDLSSSFLKTRVEDGERNLIDDWVWVDGNTRAVVHTDDTYSDEGPFDVQTWSVGPSNPPGATLSSESFEEPPSADDIAWIRALLAADPRREWDAAAPAHVATVTGLSTAAATQLLAAGPGYDEWGNDHLGDARAALGLKVREAEAGRDELRRLDRKGLTAVLAAAAPDDPAQFSAAVDAERVAAAFVERFGRLVPVPPELRIAAERLFDDATVIEIAANPASHAALVEDPVVAVDAELNTSVPEGAAVIDLEVVRAIVCGVPWLLAVLPVGDPLRANAIRVVGLAADRLRSETLWLDAGTTWMDDEKASRKLLDLVGGESDGATGRRLPGLRVLATDDQLCAIVHPATFGDDAANALAAISAKCGDDEFLDAGRALTFARRLGEWRSQLAEERLPDGAFASNPAVSVPDLVAEVAAAKKVSADAATLWLQTLALPNPTKKDVCAWNGWTAKVYQKAADDLVTAKLLLEAKRARAGRDHFLPGAWVDKKPVPFERWKVTQLDGVERRGQFDLPFGRAVSLHLPQAAFRLAWARVRGGDAPKFG